AHVLGTPDRLRRPLIVADPAPLTLSQMLAAMRRGLGRQPGLVPVPAPLLRFALKTAGHADSWPFVTGSLVANPAALRGRGWTPKVTTDEGLEQLMRSTPQIAGKPPHAGMMRAQANPPPAHRPITVWPHSSKPQSRMSSRSVKAEPPCSSVKSQMFTGKITKS